MQGETTPSAAKTETISPPLAHQHHHTSVLFHHEPHQHQPRNVNLLLEAEKAAAGINTRIAVGLTKSAQPHRRLTRCLDFANADSACLITDYHGGAECARTKNGASG